MFYILLNTNDTPAIWLYHQLRKQGFTEIEMVTAEELLYNKKLFLQMAGGKAIYRIELADGRVLCNDTCKGFINRIKYLPYGLVQTFAGGERNYVSQEVQAMFHYWFASLSNVLFNTCTTNGFSGSIKSKIEWLMLAKTAGFTTLPFFQNTVTSVMGDDVSSLPLTELLCFNQKVFSLLPLPANNIINQCIQLQKLSGEQLLQISIYKKQDEWFFAEATADAQLHYGGRQFIEHIKTTMQYGTVMRHTRRQTV
jgi:hypothetical protein